MIEKAGVRARILVSALALCVVPSLPARAQQVKDTSAADALFREGRQAAEKGDHETACAKFQESLKLDVATGTMLNLGDCKARTGKLVEALFYFERGLARLKPGDERISDVQQELKKLRAKIPRLRIALAEGSPSDTEVKLDGKQLAAEKLGSDLTVNPGRHAISVRASGRVGRRYTITLRERETRSASVDAGPPKATEPGSGDSEALIDSGEIARTSEDAKPTQPTEPDKASSGSGRTLGFVIGGLGLAGLGVGMVTGAMVFGKKGTIEDHCDSNKACDQEGLDAVSSARTLSTVSTVATAVGVVGIAVGGYLVLSSPSGPSPSSARLRWSATGTGRAAFAHLAAEF